jgi:hypothetical protein
MKLVGYILRSDLRTSSNTNYIVKRAYRRLWIVRRLKGLGANTDDLLRVLRAQVISVLTFVVPAWTTMLTKMEESQIENVQKVGLYLIYGSRYQSYNWALQESNLISLKEQRTNIFNKFTKQCISSVKFSKWFEKYPSHPVNTRNQKTFPKYKPVYSRTKSFSQSPIPQMVTVANTLQNNMMKPHIVTKSGVIIVL